MMIKRPYSDLDDLVAAATDQAVDERILPAVKKLENATKRLEDITPLLSGIVGRQNVQTYWLAGLSIVVIIIGVILIDHLSF